MDQPRSHTTPNLALRSDDTPTTFSPHPKLPPLTAALLEHRHRELREQDNDAAWLHDRALSRLVSDDAMRSLVSQLRRRQAGNYVQPTVLVGIWRRPDLRPDLKRLWVRLLNAQKTDFTWQDFRTWFQSAADHEREHREILMFILLDKLAELASRPDESYVAKVASPARAAREEWQAAETLRAGGFPYQAARCMQLACMHLNYARKLAQEWTPDEKSLIRAVRGSLSWQLGFLGYGIAAKLVGAALGRPINRWRAYRLIKY